MKESDEWETPQALFDELDEEFYFVLDCCATINNTKCNAYCGDYLATKIEDHCGGNTFITAFMHPPYYNPLPFVKKAYDDSIYIKIVCLLKCDPSTHTWGVFWDYDRHCPKPGIEIRFIPKRLKFELRGEAGTTAPFPSVIVIMDRRG